ncbi:MAG: N-acetylmuramoyl-L-alanine amidase, partial [Endomicrobiia bacterium]|nr:N-acetylmuramoyl-L-alanine amidase [Endomicrobiia bacterium]
MDDNKKTLPSSEIVLKIEGIGPVFAKKLASFGINNFEDLRSMDVAAHVGTKNPGNVGVAVIGDYDIADITETQHRRIVELGAWLCNAFAISVDKINGHRDFEKANTICPGRYLHARIERIKS